MVAVMERCEVCWKPLPKRTKGQRGRPRQYHKLCKAWVDRLKMLSDAAEALSGTLGAGARKRCRGELMLLMNTTLRAPVATGKRKDFGERVRTRRLELGWTQRALAQELGGKDGGWRNELVSSIERGAARFSKARSAAIVAVLWPKGEPCDA